MVFRRCQPFVEANRCTPSVQGGVAQLGMRDLSGDHLAVATQVLHKRALRKSGSPPTWIAPDDPSNHHNVRLSEQSATQGNSIAASPVFSHLDWSSCENLGAYCDRPLFSFIVDPVRSPRVTANAREFLSDVVNPLQPEKPRHPSIPTQIRVDSHPRATRATKALVCRNTSTWLRKFRRRSFRRWTGPKIQ